MKAKVRMVHAVEFFVEAESEEQIQDWMDSHSPNEAIDEIRKQNGDRYMYVEHDYSDEIICCVREDSEVDMKIGE